MKIKKTELGLCLCGNNQQLILQQAGNGNTDNIERFNASVFDDSYKAISDSNINITGQSYADKNNPNRADQDNNFSFELTMTPKADVTFNWAKVTLEIESFDFCLNEKK